MKKPHPKVWQNQKADDIGLDKHFCPWGAKMLVLPPSSRRQADAFDADEKKLMAQGVAAFGGIAPTYRIALLDKPTIVWDFHSLLIGLQMMFSFMMAED